MVDEHIIVMERGYGVCRDCGGAHADLKRLAHGADWHEPWCPHHPKNITPAQPRSPADE